MVVLHVHDAFCVQLNFCRDRKFVVGKVKQGGAGGLVVCNKDKNKTTHTQKNPSCCLTNCTQV